VYVLPFVSFSTKKKLKRDTKCNGYFPTTLNDLSATL